MASSQDDRQLAKRLIVEIVRQSNGEFQGKVRLNKAFYLAQLCYAAKHPTPITRWPIVHQPLGPAVHDLDGLIRELRRDGALHIESVPIGPYHGHRFRLGPGAERWNLPDDQKSAVREAVTFVKERRGDELTEITHECSRAWQCTRDGEEMDIYLDVISDEEFEEREESLAALDPIMKEVFGEDAAHR